MKTYEGLVCLTSTIGLLCYVYVCMLILMPWSLLSTSALSGNTTLLESTRLVPLKYDRILQLHKRSRFSKSRTSLIVVKNSIEIVFLLLFVGFCF